jgi:hypothetical protein
LVWGKRKRDREREREREREKFRSSINEKARDKAAEKSLGKQQRPPPPPRGLCRVAKRNAVSFHHINCVVSDLYILGMSGNVKKVLK